MICVICENDSWENVDEIARFKPEGMAICKHCGFISYPDKYKSEEEIKEYYRKNYRQAPNANNLYSGQRKLHYHNDFLVDVYKEFNEKKDKQDLNVFEIGAAFGMTLHNIRNQVPHAKIFGTELTESYRKNAMQEFGIKLEEDFDQSRKYDLLISYKVAEHQLDIHKRMQEYVSCLKEEGYFYISVPCWFDTLENFGAPGFDLNYYYDTNHINVWTRKHFEGLLKKSHLEIIKQDHICYGSTYLCKKKTEDKLEIDMNDFYENPEDIKKKLATIKQVYILSQESRYEEALALWPNYPVGQMNRFELNRKDAFKKGWDYLKKECIDLAINSCPLSPDMFSFAADIALRSKKFKECIEYVNKYLEARPNSPQGFMLLINCFRELALHSKDEKEKAHYFTQARDVSRTLNATSLQQQKESLDLIYLFNSKI